MSAPRFEPRVLRQHGRRLAVFGAGTLIVGVAIALLARADLGFSPYDMLASGVSQRLGIELGTASWLVAVAGCLIAWALGKRPGLGTLILALTVGTVIDLALRWLPQINAVEARGLVAAGGIALLWLAAALIVASDYGAGPPELVMLGLGGRGWPIQRARWLIEAACFGVGLLLGGTFGLVTVVMVIVTGPVLQWLIPLCARLAGTQPAQIPHPR